MPVSTFELLKDQHPAFITLPQAAKIVGNNPSTWYKWLSDGTFPIPTVMIGSNRRIRLIDLCNYVDSQIQGQQQQPKPEPEPQKKEKRGVGRPPKVNPAALIHAPA